VTSSQFAHDLVVTAIDLTSACAAHELYPVWLELHSTQFNGSAGIANYLCLAAVAFEEQAHPQVSTGFDPFVAREILADILIASAPLSCDELQSAVGTAISEAVADCVPPNADEHVTAYGIPMIACVPATHSKFKTRKDTKR
jgi:hypothetical protein